MKKYFITGIGTEVGKTVVAAILTECLQADYWKPIQSGSEKGTDKEAVRSLVSNSKSVFHPEAYCFKMPVSPHAAATDGGVVIELETIQIPNTSNHLIIEGAGGLMVPLNEKELIIDLIVNLGLPVILVSSIYLGSINHTLLSIDILKKKGIEIAGIIFNGKLTPSTEMIIERFAKVTILGRIEKKQKVDAALILHYAQFFKGVFN